MFKLRLSVRLVVGVLLVQVLTLGLLTLNGLRLIQTEQNRLLDGQIRRETALAATALAAPLARGDREALLDILEQLRDDPLLRYASVFDARSRPLATLGEAPPLQSLSIPEGFQSRLNGQVLAVERGIGPRLGLLQVGYHLGAAGLTFRHFWVQSTLIALGGLALTGLTILLTGLSLRRDLERVAQVARALREERLEQRIEPVPPGVLGQAATDLNELALYLERNRQRLRSRNEQLVQEARRLNGLLHGINAVVWEVNPATGRFQYVSGEAERLLGYPARQWLQPDFLNTVVHPGDLPRVRGFLTQPGHFAGSLSLDLRMCRQGSDYLWLRLIGSMELREQGPALTGLLLDVTEEKRSEQRISWLADHDSLTDLINRRRFQERLDEQIAYARRYNTCGALLFIDVDQFKYINDTYGHHTGDEYLRQVAKHLIDKLRETDIIGRLGGDEFGIILLNANEQQANRAAQLLLKYLNGEEFIHDGRRIPFSASIGIALFPQHGDQASELLAKADSAMYNAKDQGRNTWRTFEESIDVARMQDKIHWEDRIRQALKDHRFKLYFQPIVDIRTGAIHHYESLLRMLGEKGEVIGPAAFIGIAERFGLIRDIDHWVVETAIRAQGASNQIGRPVALTVNLSGRHFGSSDMLELVQEATRRYQASPNNIVFEVTETAAVENFTNARDFIEALRDMGYRFALDDFGAGFSSFHYLKHIPVDFVKIDGSFVRNLSRDPADRIFVKAIAEMAQGLNVTTIAEFVENRETVEVLRSLQVNMGQGYYFGKPHPDFIESGQVDI